VVGQKISMKVSVLFNEPKLLKSYTVSFNPDDFVSFSALQRAEIAEILVKGGVNVKDVLFQCSSTSRNC